MLGLGLVLGELVPGDFLQAFGRKRRNVFLNQSLLKCNGLTRAAKKRNHERGRIDIPPKQVGPGLQRFRTNLVGARAAIQLKRKIVKTVFLERIREQRFRNNGWSPAGANISGQAISVCANVETL